MTPAELTEEFVKHFQKVRGKMTGGKPADLSNQSLVKDRQFQASIRELYLDWRVLDELQARARQRDWPDAHPEFSKVYLEKVRGLEEEHQVFGKRWKEELLALLRRECDQIFSEESIFDWFLRLSERCYEIEALRVQHPYDAAVLRIERVTRDIQAPELADLFCEDPELFERLPGLGYGGVNLGALRETEEEAKRQAEEAARREAEEAAKPEYEKAITRLHATMWDPDQGPGDEDDWFFDPQRHSAAELISALAGYCHDRGGDLPLWQRCAGAFDWLRDTVGLDLREIETRWHQIAPISVPRDVSESYEVDHPESLFGYLGQVRLAYMIGADLAALAMCRTVTENLFRRHYNNDKNTDLPTLVKSTQEKPRCGFMKHLYIVDSVNIVDRVDIADGVKEANRILHSEGEDTRRKTVPRELVKGWARVLAELIRQAPPVTRR
jgi:hypothetical protein